MSKVGTIIITLSIQAVLQSRSTSRQTSHSNNNSNYSRTHKLKGPRSRKCQPLHLTMSLIHLKARMRIATIRVCSFTEQMSQHHSASSLSTSSTHSVTQRRHQTTCNNCVNREAARSSKLKKSCRSSLPVLKHRRIVVSPSHLPMLPRRTRRLQQTY